MNIIITGASKGLGRAIAESFAKAGNTLFLCARKMDALQEASVALLEKYPQSQVFVKAVDMSKPEEINAFAAWCLAIATPDVLINNAGQYLPGFVHNEPDGTLEHMIATNLYSAYYCTKAFMPAMKAAQRGHIFNMCSVASLQAYANGGSYSISKFALAGYTMNLREEMKPFGIKVTGIYPGAAYTDSWVGSGVLPERIMQAEDVATMVYAAAQLSAQACVEDIVLRPQLGDL